MASVDQPFGFHVDGDLQGRRGGSLAGPGLQHVELVLLDRELDVLHVAVMAFENRAHLGQLAEHRRHGFLHRRQLAVLGLFAGDGQLLRRADAGDHILALGVDQELAVKAIGAGRRVAGEGDAGGAIAAHIAEDHGLHIDGGAPGGGNIVQAAVNDGPLVHPGFKHRADGAP